MTVNTGTPQDTAEDDAWSTGEGFKDDFDGYIHEPFFGTDEQYNATAVLFAADLVDENGQPITTLKYSVGAGWIPSADGSSISHQQKTKINNSARFGMFIDRIAQPATVKAPKSNDLISPAGAGQGLGLGPTLKQRGSPLEAKSYDGLGFHWKLHTATTLEVDPETQKRKTKQVLLPVSYLGVYKGGNGVQPTAAVAQTRPVATAQAATTPAPAPSTAASTNAEGIALPAALRKKLTPLATSSQAREFIKAASKDADVIAADDAVMNYILDGGPNGFWASLNS